MRPPHRFAIEGDHLTLRHRHDCLHPIQKTRQPVAFGLPKGLHIHPIIRAAKDGREGNHDNIQ